MASEFSLGDAIVKSPSSPVHAPETWRRDLLHKHLDSAGRRSVALTCKGALAWVLQDGPNATLTVRVRASTAELPEDTLHRLRAARRTLAMRGTRPTTLALQQDGTVPEGDAWWVAYLSALSQTEPAPHIRLSLKLHHLPAELLRFAGGAFPGLQSLTLGTPHRASDIHLPHPAALPSLRHLTIHFVASNHASRVSAHLSAYMSQLVSLSIMPKRVRTDGGGFDFDTPSNTLRRLTLPYELDPELCATLQSQFRGLEELTVTGVAAVDADSVAAAAPAATWGLRKLTLSQAESLPGCAWGWLPMPRHGKLAIHMTRDDSSDGPTVVDIDLPISEEVAAKFGQVKLVGCAQVRLSAVDELTDTEVESLRAALPHLTPLHSPHITLVLDSFTLDAAFVELLAQAAVGWQVLSLQAVTWPVASPPTTLPTLGFIDIAQPMNDQVLQQLAACLTAVNICVYTPRVSLQAALPAGRRLPWPGVYAETRMSVSELVNQAGLMGGSIDWDCEHLELCLSMEEVKAGLHHQLATKLRTVRVSRAAKFDITMHEECVHAFAPLALRASLQVLRALSCKPKQLNFRDWPAGAACVAEFAALARMPVLQQAGAGSATLGLYLMGDTKPEPGQVWPISRLPQLLPRSYGVWTVDALGLGPSELDAFVLSVPADSTAQPQPTKVTVCDRDSAWAEAMQARLHSAGLYEHVRVVGKSDDSQDEWKVSACSIAVFFQGVFPDFGGLFSQHTA